MSSVKQYTPAKLVICVLISKLEYKSDLIGILSSVFGESDYQSELMQFTFSNYYDDEMGTPIYRFFISFARLVDPSSIAEIKLKTNSIENNFLENNNRKINIDPGFLFSSKFILATAKDGSYRMPLHSGIYAEITLTYSKNNFQNVELTYPDFQSETYKAILRTIREIYKSQLKSQT
jgi:hypothetical protein